MKNRNNVIVITAGRQDTQPLPTPHLRVARAPLGIQITLDWLTDVTPVRRSESSSSAAPVDIGEHRAKKRQEGSGSKQARENGQQ